MLVTKHNAVSPGVISGKGRVTAHEEADQQSENDKFCLTLHPDLYVRKD